MAPAAASLFHPKKKQGARPNGLVKGPTAPRPPPNLALRSPRKPATPAVEEEAGHPAPKGDYIEFKLVSANMDGWKYDVMKFDSRKPIEVDKWARPVKLNRKDPHRGDASGSATQVPVGPMLGLDGKPVVGPDGKIVMMDADGRPIHAPLNGAAAADKDPKKGAKRFQKKTRQVFLVPEETRQLRKEERCPWVMEDAAGQEVWQGQMEEVSKSSMHAFFMPGDGNEFKFVPAHRWYKFQKRPNYRIPDLEEAEALMAKKNAPNRWLLHGRNVPGGSAGGSMKMEVDSSLVHSAGSSLAMGADGRPIRLRTVAGAPRGSADEDEDGIDWSRKKEDGGEGDLDEVDFDEAPADDEDRMDADDREDEETKELEERLKREYKAANKQQQDGYVDDDNDDDGEPSLTKEGKRMKKLLRNRDQGETYDSDDEKNPYASSEEEEEEEEPVVATGPAIQAQDAQSRHSTPKASTPGTQTPARGRDSVPTSRATSPVGHGGHSVVAKRATSPKGPKVKPGDRAGSRATSPLVGVGSRATSPTASASRAGSPPVAKPNNKRKAEDGVGGAQSPAASGAAGPKAKKRKAGSAPSGQLTVDVLLEWIRNTPNATTKDCIGHFKPLINSSEETKKQFTQMVQKVAQLKNGVLVLRPDYQGGSAVPSPAT